MPKWVPFAAGAAAALVSLRVLYVTYKRMSKELTYAVLKLEDSTTTTAIIESFTSDPKFQALANTETADILKRDAEDDEKLAAGIKMAIAKGVLAANPPVEPLEKIDVLGKSADAVASMIIAKLGDAPQKGCGTPASRRRQPPAGLPHRPHCATAAARVPTPAQSSSCRGSLALARARPSPSCSRLYRRLSRGRMGTCSARSRCWR